MSVDITQFRSFEVEQSVFDLRIDGIPVWERIRIHVYRKIRQHHGSGQAHTTITKSIRDYMRGIFLFTKNIIYRNPFFSKQSNMIFFGHERRKKESDGYWWDIYCDPIHKFCEFDYVHFESDYLLQHSIPAKTENIRYLDFIQYGSTIGKSLGINKPKIRKYLKNELRRLENKIHTQFGVEIDVIGLVQSKHHHRNIRLSLYKRLLEQVDPELVVLVVSYGKETLIESCKNSGIPVIELQHGVIHDGHMGYSYPGQRTKEMFPDYLFVWGEYWKNAVEYPIPDERVIPVGYPYLEQTVKKYEDTKPRDQILFISQGTIGAQLSKFAMKVNQHPDISHDVVYKLHPGEYDRWRDEYPWLTDADFEIIDSSEPPLYEIFAESSAQIGVGSTAVYEGLCFDLETFVYDCPGSSVLEALVDEGAAQLVTSVDELASSLGRGEVTFDREYFFEPNATENACQTLQQLAAEGTSRGLEHTD